MYSLMIAEDELATRRGLVNMVNWESLGFRVTADFADGKELLERLGNYSMLPDVILTDIQMIQVSGLDIAKYVADNGLPVKVVLLTGYKLFEYAQAAIENHVASYLLKPVSITNLKQVFSGLKEQLDQEKDKKEYKEKMSRYYNRLVNYEKQKYILDAYYGMLSITCRAEVIDKLQPLELTGYFAAIGHSEKRETLMREAEYNQLLKNQRKLIFHILGNSSIGIRGTKKRPQ